MKVKNTFLALSLLCIAGTSHATLTQNGNGTFTDTATGYQWQNLSTFWDVDSSVMSTLLLPHFHFATESELNTLLASAPADPSRFASDAAAMGVPLPTTPLTVEDIIWGLYGDLESQAYKFQSETQWTVDVAPLTSYPVLGAFAVAVPEPEINALLLAGLGLLGFAARRRKQNAA